jgi:hypothetical protein
VRNALRVLVVVSVLVGLPGCAITEEETSSPDSSGPSAATESTEPLISMLSIPVRADLPAPPPPPTLEQAVTAATMVLMVDGIALHWIAIPDGGGPWKISEGPTHGSRGHRGTLLLEAHVIERIYCMRACAERFPLLVQLSGHSNMLDRAKRLVGGRYILLLGDTGAATHSLYPGEVPQGTYATIVNRETYVIPVEERAQVESAIKATKPGT